MAQQVHRGPQSSKIPLPSSPYNSLRGSLQGSKQSSLQASKQPSKTGSPTKLTLTPLTLKLLPKFDKEFYSSKQNNSQVISQSKTQGKLQDWNIVCSRKPAKSLESPFAPYFSNETPINQLGDKLLKKIFSFVNHSDLILCCAVQRYWHHLITSDPAFLDRTVCVISIKKLYVLATDVTSYTDLTTEARTPFRHARIQFVDHRYYENPQNFIYRNSDNQLYFPDLKFLSTLVTLELKRSFFLWHTVKRLLVKAVQLETLKITSCYISDLHPPPTSQITMNHDEEFDEFKAGNAIFSLRNLEIYESRALRGITTILKKFSGYKNQNLVSLKIAYHPPENSEVKTIPDTAEDSAHFCAELKDLLTLCANSLQVLILDIHHEPTLDLIGDDISKTLATLGPRMNLKEYQLTVGLGCWEGKPESMPKSQVTMKRDSQEGGKSEESVKAAAIAIGIFLESQKNLEKLSIPCIAYPLIYSPEFKLNFSRLPCADKLNFLSIPSAGFLLPEFLEQFPSLSRIKVGGTCCSDYTSGWEIFKLYMLAKERTTRRGPLSLKSPQARSSSQSRNDFFRRNQSDHTRFQEEKSLAIRDPSQKGMGRIKELCISSCSMPANFSQLAENLTGLTLLEISCPKAIFTDEHMQACIAHLPQLWTLMIGCSDQLTDYGISGIPVDYAMLMFKLQRYHNRGVNLDLWRANNFSGRPLSDLKGLRKLVLLGNSRITDIGMGYGLAFKELKYCHLPYSDYVMAWGIEKFGEMNPSLETLVTSGVNQHCKEAFLKLRKTHERMKRGDVTRSGYFVEKVSPVNDDFSLVLPSPPTYLVDLCKKVAGKVGELVSLFGSAA